MIEKLYRFRSIEGLIGEHEELKKQEIYFASPSQLNDPMEGYRDIYWSGDAIIWRNLFKHYLYCLQELVMRVLIAGDEHKLTSDDIPVSGSIDNLPTEEYKTLFREISNRFLSIKLIEKLLDSILLRSTPIRKEELEFYLSSMHLMALQTVFDVFIEEGLSPKSNKINGDVSDILKQTLDTNYIENIEEVLKEYNGDEKIINSLFAAQNQTHRQINLLSKYNHSSNNNQKNKSLLLVDFPRLYISSLSKLCFPDWYTACFMSDCENSSVWGHYASNHSGVCLVFKPTIIENDNFITLKGINGWGNSGPSYGNRKLQLHKIDYILGQADIDFFKSIGRLPIPVLNEMWYYSETGEASMCSEDFSTSEETWRNKYWENFYRDITKKSLDWEYENEYRIILAGSIIDYSKPSRRLLTYDFSLLDGLIFGINTKEEDKLEIIKIIERKCKENKRNDFNFYQAYYSFPEGKIKHSKLGLIRFQHEM